MCIVLLSTAHPAYDLILLSNRDEYFTRPTEPLAEHDPSIHSHSRPDEKYVYGRDTLRGGTWLAISTTGRFAALTNFKTPANEVVVSPLSRGSLPISFLESDSSPSTFANSLLRNEETQKVGGFSLLCGDLKRIEDGVVVVSNKSPKNDAIVTFSLQHGENEDDEAELLRGWSCELSNSLVSQTSPKVRLGRSSLKAALENSLAAGDQEEELVDRLFQVLSTDTIKEHTLAGLADSVFIPQFDTGADFYGTRQQTVWLLTRDTITVVERTIHADSLIKTSITIKKRTI